MTNWLKRLFGGSDSDDAPEPAAAPEPPSMPSEPVTPPAETGAAADEPAGNEPA